MLRAVNRWLRPGRSGSLVIEIGQGQFGQRFPHDSLKCPNHVVVFRCDQCESVAGAFRAPGAPDAVDVGVGGIGHVEVDHVRDALHIQAARGDVGGDHDLVSAVLEALECGLTLSLRAVAVQAGDVEAGARDLLGNTVGAVFGAGEDQDGIGVGLLEQGDQQRPFQMLGHRVKRMGHRVRRAAEADRDALWGA